MVECIKHISSWDVEIHSNRALHSLACKCHCIGCWCEWEKSIITATFGHKTSSNFFFLIILLIILLTTNSPDLIFDCDYQELIQFDIQHKFKITFLSTFFSQHFSIYVRVDFKLIWKKNWLSSIPPINSLHQPQH